MFLTASAPQKDEYVRCGRVNWLDGEFFHNVYVFQITTIYTLNILTILFLVNYTLIKPKLKRTHFWRAFMQQAWFSDALYKGFFFLIGNDIELVLWVIICFAKKCISSFYLPCFPSWRSLESEKGLNPGLATSRIQWPCLSPGQYNSSHHTAEKKWDANILPSSLMGSLWKSKWV